MTATKFPLCSKMDLLRTTSGWGNEQLVVSSAALYAQLGEKKYQQFISTLDNHYMEPVIGFRPSTVEEWLGREG